MVEMEESDWNELRLESSNENEAPDIPDSDSTDVTLWLRNMANVSERCLFLFIYYVIFTQEYPISAQHCSPWGSCITCMTKTNINQHTFSYNTVTTLTTWYIHHTCIMLTTYTCR